MTDSVFVIEKTEPRTKEKEFFCVRSCWLSWTTDVYEAIRFADENSANMAIAQLSHEFGRTYQVLEFEWPWETE